MNEGDDATPPADPAKEGYTFNGWHGNYKNVTEDRTIVAKYIPVPVTPSATTVVPSITYTVTFVDWNGNVISVVTVKPNEDATAPTDPKRSGYSFSGWNGDYTNVTEDRTITATYTPVTTPSKPSGGGGTASTKVYEPDPAIIEIIEPVQVVEPEPVIESEPTPEPAPIVTPEPEPTPEPVIEPEPIEEPEIEEVVEEEPEEEQEIREIEEVEIVPVEEPSRIPLIAVAVAVAVSGVCMPILLLIWSRRRVRGTILDENGEAVEGLRVTLSGKEDLETRTDDKGFIFKRVKNDNLLLTVYGQDDATVLFSCEIYTDTKDEDEIFVVLEDATQNVITDRHWRTYTVDIEA